MECIVEPQGSGVALIRLSGRLDLAVAADVKQRLVRTVAQGQRILVVDLKEVSFIDSSGLGALIGGLKMALLAGGELRVAQPNDQVRLVFELTSLERVIRLFPNVETALSG